MAHRPENAFSNDSTVEDLRTRTYNGDTVTDTTCSFTGERYLIVQRYPRSTDRGDRFEYESKTTGGRDWQLFVDQWRRRPEDAFTPFLTRWSVRR